MKPSPRHRSGLWRRRRRGSVLLTTTIFAAGIALALGSFLTLSLNSARLSNQSFYANGAINLAEAGLEQALHAMNQDSFTGWSTHAPTGANSLLKVTSNLDLGHGNIGEIRVLIYDVTTKSRRIVAEGSVKPSSGPVVRKQIEITASRRSTHAMGLVAKDGITFSGNNVQVDSWNSDPDQDPSTAAVPYSSATKRSYGNVASNAVTVDIGNADVWGYIRTGGEYPDVGPNGTLAEYGQPVGTKDFANRAFRDFKHFFKNPEKPPGMTLNVITSTIGNSDLPMTLPQPGDVAWYDPEDQVMKYCYQLPGIDVSGNTSKVLTIGDNVVLLPTAGSGATGISVTGSASIRIESDAHLEVYTEANVDVGGNGFVNSDPAQSTMDGKLQTANQPKQLEIYGTNTSIAGQTISIRGNGVLSATVDAPNANVSMTGGGTNGHILGSVVGKTITITGNSSFHYDESLKEEGGDNPFELGEWRELLGAERKSF